MDIVESLFDEAQDNPDSLYWKAAETIEQLRQQLAERDRAVSLPSPSAQKQRN